MRRFVVNALVLSVACLPRPPWPRSVSKTKP